MKAKIIFYVISIAIYQLIIYVIAPYLAKNSSHGGDAMGSGMAQAYGTILYVIIFSILAFIVSIIVSKTYLHAYLPALLSLIAGIGFAYILFAGNEYLESNRKHEYTEYYESGVIREKGKKTGRGGLHYKHGEISYYNEKGRIEKIETRNRGILDGMYRDFYENGTLKSEGKLTSTSEYYDKGYKKGEWKFYRPDGQLDDVRTYLGLLSSSRNYRLCITRDNQICIIQDYSLYSGKLDKTPIITEFSVLPPLFSANVKNGYFDGQYIQYYASNYQVVEQIGYFEKGLPHGKITTYYENGQLKQIENYENGKLEGEYITYYSDSLRTMPHGHIRYSCLYANDERNGTACWYDSNGKLETQTQYSFGSREGISRTYDTQTGKIVAETLYKADDEVSTP